MPNPQRPMTPVSASLDPGLSYFSVACMDFTDTCSSRSEADFEIGMMRRMADEIVMTVRRLKAFHGHLDHATGSVFCAWSVASQFIDAMGMTDEAASVLQAAIERRIPAPHRSAVSSLARVAT